MTHDTSQILHRRAVNQYVAASVDLLVDFVLMFLYVLMILLNSSRD
jgi:FtsH-binding integral membrane protein